MPGGINLPYNRQKAVGGDGLMAVYVPAGENEIEFTYHTPGLKASACVSAAAIAVYGVYLLGIIIKRKSQPGSKR